jgi:hypothetical protein
MAPRTRFSGTLDSSRTEHSFVRTGGNVGRSTLIFTADAEDAAASAAAALASENAAETAETNAEAALATMIAADYMPKTGGEFTGDIQVSNDSGEATITVYGTTHGAYWMGDTTAGANLKWSRIAHEEGATYFQLMNDDFSLKNTALTINANATATFGATVTINSGELVIERASPLVRLKDTSSTANTRQFSMAAESNALSFNAYNDAGVWQRTLGFFDHTGGFTSAYGATFGADVGVSSATAATITVYGGGSGEFWMGDTGAGSNLKWSRISHDEGIMHLQLMNDDFNTKSTPLQLNADSSATFGSTVAAIGYRSRNDTTYGGNYWNYYWTGAVLQAWIDGTNVGNVSLVSDGRYKHSVAPLAVDALGQITTLRPVTYRWQDKGIFKDDGKVHLGFIAQEVAKVIPEAVNEDTDVKTLEILPLLSTMVKAMQEMAAKIARLEAQNGPTQTPSSPKSPKTPQGETRRGSRAGYYSSDSRPAQKGKSKGVAKVAPVKKGPRRKAANLPSKGNRRR